ncbi:hypothetical protein OSTOST_08921, partial [Ostertagia ostertagi]
MGLVGGSISRHSGYKHAAFKGQKLIGMLREVRMRSTITGVQFAAWGGMFSTIDCGLVAIRKKPEALDDPRNLPPPKSHAEPGLHDSHSTMPFGLPSALPNMS